MTLREIQRDNNIFGACGHPDPSSIRIRFRIQPEVRHAAVALARHAAAALESSAAGVPSCLPSEFCPGVSSKTIILGLVGRLGRLPLAGAKECDKVT